MRRFIRVLVMAAGCLSVLWLVGCAIEPTVGGTYGPPKSIVIEQIPRMRLGAYIAPGLGMVFTPYGDHNFEAPANALSAGDRAATVPYVSPVVPPPPVNAGAVGGAMGAIIQIGAEDTQRKAMKFDEAVREQMPGTDLGGEFMRAVQSSLEQQGIRVSTVPASYPLRVRWPVPDLGRLKFETQPNNPPAVDADLYVQIGPLAVYQAPGPLNAYFPSVKVVVLVYDGRTKQFLRMQHFQASQRFKANYYTYAGLQGSLDEAIPALRDTLMQLVPEVVDVVSARSPER